MPKSRYTTRSGITLVEVIMASAVALVVFAGIAALLVDGQRGWNSMYARAYGDVVTDGYVATKFFDALMRKAEGDAFTISPGGDSVEVCYYATDESTTADRYALVSLSGTELNVEYGQLDPRATLSAETVCSNVSSCVFKQVGRSIEMILTLDNGTQVNSAASVGYMHN